jgi:hypothetical protein
MAASRNFVSLLTQFNAAGFSQFFEQVAGSRLSEDHYAPGPHWFRRFGVNQGSKPCVKISWSPGCPHGVPPFRH